MTRSTAGPAPAAPLPSPKERRRLREARALSEEQVAAAVGVTPATVRAWETGRTNPRGRRRVAYARLIGCAGHRPAPSPSVEATGSSTMSPTEPGTGPSADANTPDAPTRDADAEALTLTRDPDADAPAASAPEGHEPAAPVPQPRAGLTAEEAYDALYTLTAPGLTRQMHLLTGRRKLSREAVEHAFRTAWQRWPEVARDRDPGAGCGRWRTSTRCRPGTGCAAPTAGPTPRPWIRRGARCSRHCSACRPRTGAPCCSTTPWDWGCRRRPRRRRPVRPPRRAGC